MPLSSLRVAYRHLVRKAVEGVAPSAEKSFWDNPEKYEVREFAEAGAMSNDADIVKDSGKAMALTRKEIREEAHQVEHTPETPSEILDESPGGTQFSTLNRYLVETEQPIQGIPSGVVDRPMTPDPNGRLASLLQQWF